MPRSALAVCAGLALWVQLATGQSAASADDLRAIFQEGQSALAAGRLADAERAFRDTLVRDPGLAEARANLGLALFLQGDYSATVRELRQVVARRPELQAAQLFLGLSHLKLGAVAEAIPALERSLELDPKNLEAHRALAACHLAEGDYAAAVRQFQAAFEAGPDPVAGWHRLGQDYMRLMSDLAGRLVVRSPDSAWSALLGADMLGFSRAWEAAAGYYEDAIAKRPGLSGPRAALGASLLRLGRPEEAGRHFLAELELDGRAEQAHAGLAEVALAGGDAGAALRHLGAVWDSFPAWLRTEAAFPLGPLPPGAAETGVGALRGRQGGPAEFLRWRLHLAMGSQDAAELARGRFEALVASASPRRIADIAPAALCAGRLYSECARALAGQPSLSRADLLLLGRAFLALGTPERALVAFTHALRGASGELPEALYWTVRALQSLADTCFRQVESLAPESWRAHQLRAEVHRQRQDDERAVAEYRRAIEINPGVAELHRSLGLLHLLNNAHDQAEVALRRALDLDASDPRTLYFAGRLLVARQQHAEAVPYFESALRLDPNLVEARPSLGRAYLRAERFEEAAAQLERALVLDFYGDIHYSLFQAHRRLGNMDRARQALERSTQMRKRSFSRDRDRLDRWINAE